MAGYGGAVLDDYTKTPILSGMKVGIPRITKHGKVYDGNFCCWNTLLRYADSLDVSIAENLNKAASIRQAVRNQLGYLPPACPAIEQFITPIGVDYAGFFDSFEPDVTDAMAVENDKAIRKRIADEKQPKEKVQSWYWYYQENAAPVVIGKGKKAAKVGTDHIVLALRLGDHQDLWFQIKPFQGKEIVTVYSGADPSTSVPVSPVMVRSLTEIKA